MQNALIFLRGQLGSYQNQVEKKNTEKKISCDHNTTYYIVKVHFFCLQPLFIVM